MSNRKKESVEALETLVRYHNKKYFEENAPEVSDVQFDKLVNRLKRLAPDSLVLTEIADSQWFNTFSPVKREIPMLSLEKCFTLSELNSWAEQFESDFVVMAKVDGCAIELVYDEYGNLQSGATRGDGYVGEGVTLNCFAVDSIPKLVEFSEIGFLTPVARPVRVRGEICMRKSVFQEFKDAYANPRNLAAGAIRQKFASETKKYHLSFLAYDIQGLNRFTESEKFVFLNRLGFETAYHVYVRQEELGFALIEMQKDCASLDYETDGLVFKIDSLDEQEKHGSTSHHPRYAIAYKFSDEEATTVVSKIQWQVARSGLITPVAVVEPTSLAGVTITNITLHNAGRLIELGLAIGDEVAISRRGGVIPHLERVTKNAGQPPVALPTECPSCGKPAIFDDVNLDCSEPKSCVAVRLARLEHFIKTIGCDGFGPSVIAKLYEAGKLRTFADFYRITQKDMADAEVGEVIAKNLDDEIRGKLEIELHVFLAALGIESLGSQTAKLLADKFLDISTVWDEILVKPDRIFEVAGISDKKFQNIQSGVLSLIDDIDDLLKQAVVLPVVKKSEGKLNGLRFLFTGKMSSPRASMEALVADRGGVIASSVNKDLDFLVVGDDAGSKLTKAKKLIDQGAKIKIIDESEFREGFAK